MILKKLFGRKSVDPSDQTLKSRSRDDLASDFHEEITAIYRMAGTTKVEFEAHFLPMIINYLYFIQSIPAVSYSSYDRINGLSEMALVGVKNGIKIRSGTECVNLL